MPARILRKSPGLTSIASPQLRWDRAKLAIFAMVNPCFAVGLPFIRSPTEAKCVRRHRQFGPR